MKILVSNKFLDSIAGGSDNATYYLVKELSERGHEVDVFAYVKGKMWERISAFSNLVDDATGNYDIIFAATHQCAEHISRQKTRGLLNGYTVGLYRGVYERLLLGVDRHIVICKDQKQFLKQKYNIDSEIILPGIDLKRFSPKNRINKTPKRILSVCQAHLANKMIAKVCKKMSIDFIRHSKRSRAIWNIEDEINSVDLVIGVGQSINESMACGRAVIVADCRAYNRKFGGKDKIGDGIITKDNINESLENNLSGRRFSYDFTEEWIENEINKYNSKMYDFNLNFATENFDLVKKVNNYLSIKK